MKENSFDLVVLGGGPGGYVAAIRANQLGMSVALVEDKRLGGICLNWGCIPTKALLKSAEVYSELSHSTDFGIEAGNVSFDMPKIVKRSRQIAQRLSNGVAFLMKKNSVTVFNERGSLDADANVLLESGGVIKGKNVIVATGEWTIKSPPRLPARHTNERQPPCPRIS